MGLFNTLKDKAIANRQRIVLPEGTEPRTLQAANQVIADGIADIYLIGDPAKILDEAKDLGLTHIGETKIIDPNDDNFTEKYAQLFYELRKSKGITIEDARKKAKDPLYLGCLIIKSGEADGQVAGARNTTGNVLRAAFQVIKTQPGISVVSGAFLMLMPAGSPYGTDGMMVFADCAVVPAPTATELAQIAIATAKTARDIANIEPRVAMLSFSTKGSASHESVDKVVEATKLARELDPTLACIPIARRGQHRLQTRAAHRQRTSRRPNPARSCKAGQRPVERLQCRRHLQDHNHHLQPSNRDEPKIITSHLLFKYCYEYISA